jgi:hypothetical protein
MIELKKKSICAFLFCYLFIANNYECFSSSDLKLFHLKIDNSFQKWGELRIARIIDYDSLNSDGIPYNLKISNKYKLLTLKFGLMDNSSGMYRYRLIGLDNNWSKVSKKNEVSYFDLPAGKYIFIVQHFENDTLKNELKTNFEILQPLDESYYMYLISFLIYTLFFSVLFNFRTARLKRNQKNP